MSLSRFHRSATGVCSGATTDPKGFNVDRIILVEIETEKPDFGAKIGFFAFGRPNRVVYTHPAAGALRWIDDSLMI